MPSSEVPFSNQDWTDIIDRVNEMADECGVERLDGIGECHRLSRQDVLDVFETLMMVCEDNQFDALEECARWGLSFVRDIEAAIESGVCCREVWQPRFPLWDFRYQIFSERIPPRNPENDDNGPNTATVFQELIVDWADWLAQEVEPRRVIEVECLDDADGNPVPPIEQVEGGPFWVGRQFSRWTLSIGFATSADTSDTIHPFTISGDVVDGYMAIDGVEYRPAEVCGVPPVTEGTELGTISDALNFPYQSNEDRPTPDDVTVNIETRIGINVASFPVPTVPDVFGFSTVAGDFDASTRTITTPNGQLGQVGVFPDSPVYFFEQTPPSFDPRVGEEFLNVLSPFFTSGSIVLISGLEGRVLLE